MTRRDDPCPGDGGQWVPVRYRARNLHAWDDDYPDRRPRWQSAVGAAAIVALLLAVAWLMDSGVIR